MKHDDQWTKPTISILIIFSRKEENIQIRNIIGNVLQLA